MTKQPLNHTSEVSNCPTFICNMGDEWEQDVLDLCQTLVIGEKDKPGPDFLRSWEHVAEKCYKIVYAEKGKDGLRLKSHGVIKLDPPDFFEFEGGGSLTVKPMSGYVRGLMNGTITPDLHKPMEFGTTESL